MRILLALDVTTMTNPDEAKAYAKLLAEQIVELPINDDCGIRRIITTVPSEKGAS